MTYTKMHGIIYKKPQCTAAISTYICTPEEAAAMHRIIDSITEAEVFIMENRKKAM